VQICTDSRLLVDTVLYWIEGWQHKGSETKSGKLVEIVDLWQEIAAIEERTAGTPWIKVPLHVDIECNKKADGSAKQGGKQHGVQIREDKERAARIIGQKRSAPAEEREPGEGQYPGYWLSPSLRYSSYSTIGPIFGPFLVPEGLGPVGNLPPRS